MRGNRHTTLRRRLVPSALVALFAFLAVGTAFAVGSDRGSPDSITVPYPMLGDRAAYNMTLHGDWPYADVREGVAFPFAAFDFEASPPVLDATSSWRAVEVVHGAVSTLRSQTRYEDGAVLRDQAFAAGNETYYYASGTAEVIAWEGDRPSQGVIDFPSAILPANPLQPGPDSTWEGNFRFVDYPSSYVTDDEKWSYSHCWHDHPAFGRALSIGDELPFYMTRCPLAFEARVSMIAHPEFISDQGGNLSAQEWDVVGRMRALRFQGPATYFYYAPSGGPGSWLDANIDMWFAHGIPYPVKIRLADENRSVEIELVGFERGSTPRGSPSEPLDALPGLSMAPRPPWTLDDRGIDTDYPLSEMFVRARDHLEYADLREFLAWAPDAYVSEASGVGYRWRFTVSSAEESLTVEWGPRNVTGNPASGVASLAGLDEPNQVPRTVAREPRNGWLYPQPELVPAMTPTVAGLLQRWDAYAGPARPAEGSVYWEFGIWCSEWDWDAYGGGDEAPPCIESAWSAAAGRRGSAAISGSSPDTYPLIATEPYRTRIWHNQLEVSSVGGDQPRAMSLYDMSQESQMRPLIPGSHTEAPSAASGLHQGPSGLSLSLPTLPEAAGAGLIAITLGLLYWLWPTLKGGILSLFSRVTGVAVAEHPVRQEILALVQAQPGIHFRELQRRTGRASGNLAHHLGKLEGQGLLRSMRSAGYTGYVAGRAKAPPEASPALRSEGARKVYEAIRASPGANLQTVAAQAGITIGTAHYHVDRLANAGLVDARRDGQGLRLLPIKA